VKHQDRQDGQGAHRVEAVHPGGDLAQLVNPLHDNVL
jgi:hypothetical protein